MFVIKMPTGEYWHIKQQIILYKTVEEATQHLEGFLQYAMQRLGVADPFTAMEVSSAIMSCQIMPIDFDLEKNPDVKTIWRHEIEN